jgi:hypothetical protein
LIRSPRARALSPEFAQSQLYADRHRGRPQNSLA